jgi:hypothetical protein
MIAMKKFWFEVTEMNKDEHRMKTNPILVVVFLFLMLSIIGVFASPNGILKIASIVVLCLAGIIEFFNFFIRLPAKKWKQDTDRLVNDFSKERYNLYLRIEELEQQVRDSKGGSNVTT